MRRYFALFLLVAAVAFPLPARSSDDADAEALVRRYLSAYNAQDPVALAALYAEDGLLLPPNGGPSGAVTRSGTTGRTAAAAGSRSTF
jgi:hypothetical protein